MGQTVDTASRMQPEKESGGPANRRTRRSPTDNCDACRSFRSSSRNDGCLTRATSDTRKWEEKEREVHSLASGGTHVSRRCEALGSASQDICVPRKTQHQPLPVFKWQMASQSNHSKCSIASKTWSQLRAIKWTAGVPRPDRLAGQCDRP